MPARIKPEIQEGDRFGRLVVVVPRIVIERSHRRRAYSECLCDCGTRSMVMQQLLRAGQTRSCGCLHDAAIGARNLRHGESGTRLYKIWEQMIQRCHNPNASGYDLYGAKGIIVCLPWRQDYVSFGNWARDHGYQEHLTIDRVDSSKHYAPENCQWLTMAANVIKSRKPHWITAFGETKRLKDWTRDARCSVSSQTIARRLVLQRWDAERAISAPRQR